MAVVAGFLKELCSCDRDMLAILSQEFQEQLKDIRADHDNAELMEQNNLKTPLQKTGDYEKQLSSVGFSQSGP